MRDDLRTFVAGEIRRVAFEERGEVLTDKQVDEIFRKVAAKMGVGDVQERASRTIGRVVRP